MTAVMDEDRDRRVHAEMSDGSVIVRYNRAGKWYREWPHSAMIPRRALRIRDAVMYATSDEATAVYSGVPGGEAFDRQIYMHEAHEAARLWREEQGDHTE